MSVVEMISRFFSVLTTLSLRRSSFYVVTFHQLTVISLPLQPLPVPLLPVPASSYTEVCRFITRTVSPSSLLTLSLSFDVTTLTASEYCCLSCLLSHHLLGCSLSFHLLPEQRDVFDRFELCWIPKELVTVSFSLHLPQNIDSVVIPKSSAHFVIIHTKMIFLYSPQPGQTCWVHYFEDSSLLILPLNVRCVSLSRIVQQLLEEVP